MKGATRACLTICKGICTHSKHRAWKKIVNNSEKNIEVAKRTLVEFQKRSHLQPVAPTRVAASGRKRLQVAAGDVRATGRKWPQGGAVGASGRKRSQVAAGGTGFLEQVHGSHLQPPEVAASGCGGAASGGRKWSLAARGPQSKHLQTFATSRNHPTWPQVGSKRVAASGRKWPRVAASGRSSRCQASGRKRPQAAASGRKWPLQTVPSEWPQVAAFGQINFHSQSNLSGIKVF